MLHVAVDSQAALFAALIEAVLFVGSTNWGEMHLNEAVGFGACRVYSLLFLLWVMGRSIYMLLLALCRVF